MGIIANQRNFVRASQDKAAAHLQFARMFTLADMITAANYHIDKAREETARAESIQSDLNQIREF